MNKDVIRIEPADVADVQREFAPSPGLRPPSPTRGEGSNRLWPFAWKRCRIVTLIVFIAVGTSCAAIGADAPINKAAKTAIVLFDGESLANWATSEFGGTGAVVENGAIIIPAGNPLNGIHWNGEELPRLDYEITFKARRLEGNDFFVGLTFPVKKTHCSLILGGWGGGVTGISSINGFDASENQTNGYDDFENGQWYDVRLQVSDSQIQAWLDEKQIVDLEYSDLQLGVRLEMELSKPLGLATYATKAEIRDLKMRTFKTESENGAR